MKRSIEFLDASGHLSLDWEPTDAVSVERARAEFETLRQAGYSFFRVVAQQVADFDPAYGELEVRRVDAAEVEPRLEVRSPDPPRRRGRPPGSVNKPPAQAQERVIAARPMRGG